MTTSDALAARVRAMLADHPYGFLVTTSLVGGVSSRLVQHTAVDEDLSVWFGTSPSSRKAAELRSQPACAYSVEHRPSFGAATLHGISSLVDTPDARSRAWASGFEAFFPDGANGGDFVAIRFVPHRIEVIDFGHGIHPDPYGLVSMHAVRRHDGWDLASSEPTP